ncbi:MAG: thiamine biosynthesis protein ThiS [Opitutae bacterium]|jgi:sulfur carrier protein|nr:thiamine biosynthesis protein ThiS [Opitutae bacterium]|tara:strand:- start:1530 stop:1733 length:204 start_codon:yes stop_codon:yes gene_type:complete
MKIHLNDVPQEVPDSSCLSHLLSAMGVEGAKGVAVAVNGQVVPSKGWSSLEVSENDRILVIQATQGG